MTRSQAIKREIAQECRYAVERRHAARMLSVSSYIDWLSAQEPRPEAAFVIVRDPCPSCGTNGQYACAHRPAAKPEAAPERIPGRQGASLFRPKELR